MRERITKFIWMAAAVILIGTGITLFNWKGGASHSAGGTGVSMASDREESVAAQVLDEKEEPDAVAAQSVTGETGQEREAAGEEEGGAVSVRFDMGDEAEQEAAGCMPECETGAAAPIQESTEKQKNSEIIYEYTEEIEEVFEGEQIEGSEESVVLLEIYASWEDARDAYFDRLGEMDKKLTAKAEEAGKKPIVDQKTIADEIWKFWDDELNAIYQELRRLITEDEFDALREEEREWLRSRDELAARAAASENSSVNAQNLSYTRSLAESTKERVYELAEMFYSYNREERK